MNKDKEWEIQKESDDNKTDNDITDSDYFSDMNDDNWESESERESEIEIEDPFHGHVLGEKKHKRNPKTKRKQPKKSA